MFKDLLNALSNLRCSTEQLALQQFLATQRIAGYYKSIKNIFTHDKLVSATMTTTC
jgi:hypothetical protein